MLEGYLNKEQENYDAFIDFMAQLIQKYGNTILKNEQPKMEEADEQRRKEMLLVFESEYGNASGRL